MPYSIISMRKELQELGYASDVYAFAWPQQKSEVHPRLNQAFNNARPKNNELNDLTEYCWLAYSKAFFSRGDQLMGRTPDLWIERYLAQANIDRGKKDTLWESHTRGNIQLLDKWAPVVNDAWVLGGVHRYADYVLVSGMTVGNLWSFAEKFEANKPQRGFHVVTGRELLGLREFGYTFSKAGQVKLVCSDRDKAAGATLRAYHTLMSDYQKTGPDSIRSLLETAPVLDEIRGFDRGRLKHVEPAARPAAPRA